MITDAVAKAISSVFESTFKGLDDLFTNDEERGKIKALLLELQTKLVAIIQKTITERWDSDNKSGSMLSRNIRPALYLAIVASYLILAFSKSYFGVDVSEKILNDLYELVQGYTYAYVGSRGVEKIVSMAGNTIVNKGGSNGKN